MSRFSAVTLIMATVLVAASNRHLVAEEEFEPGDPIAAVDGRPIYLGELNLILTERWSPRQLDQLPLPIQQATAALLVRRHLAMKSLRQQGGDALDAMIRRQVEAYASELDRRSSSMAEAAQKRRADENSLRADLGWQIAWGRYLKSRLTDENLRRFYEQRKDHYGGGRWDVSQIFVPVESTDPESVDATRQRMSELAEELRGDDAPESAFAQAARQSSEAGSAEQGGRVGWVQHSGDLPGAVMGAIRSAAAGQIVGPIQSPLGMHLVLVHQFEAGTKSFDELADHAQLRRDAADALFDTLVSRQRDAKVTWFISALKPPQDVPLVP